VWDVELERHTYDFGEPRGQRHLKSRAPDEGGTVPCDIPMITYTRAWRAARKLVLTEEAQETPLVARLSTLTR
jgi:hypothetical protein